MRLFASNDESGQQGGEGDSAGADDQRNSGEDAEDEGELSEHAFAGIYEVVHLIVLSVDWRNGRSRFSMLSKTTSQRNADLADVGGSRSHCRPGT